MSATVDWIVAAALLLGAVAICALGGYATRGQRARTLLHAGAAAIGAVLYATIAAGGRTPLGPSAIDTHHLIWLLATPLLLASMMVSPALAGRAPLALPMAATVVFVDLVMVLGRAVAAAQYGAAAWIWFAVSLAAMALLFALLRGPVRQAALAGPAGRAALYRRQSRWVIVLWSLWPLVFFLGPDFQALFGPALQETLLGSIDIAAIAAFGLFAVLEDERLTAQERGVEHPYRTARARLADALAADRGLPATLPPPAMTRDVARARLLSLGERGGEAARRLARTGRAQSVRALEAGRRDLAALMPRRPAPPPPAPRPYRRRRAPPSTLLDTPFGRLTREDAVPVAFVVATLLVVAYAGGKRRT